MNWRALSCGIMIAVSLKLLAGLASGDVPETKVGKSLSIGDVGIHDLAIKIDKGHSCVRKDNRVNICHRYSGSKFLRWKQTGFNHGYFNAGEQWCGPVGIIKVQRERHRIRNDFPVYPCVNFVGGCCAKVLDVEHDRISNNSSRRHGDRFVIRDINAGTVEHNRFDANICSLLAFSSSFRALYQVAGGDPKKRGNHPNKNSGKTHNGSFVMVEEFREVPKDDIQHVVRGAPIYAAVLIFFAFLAFRL